MAHVEQWWAFLVRSGQETASTFAAELFSFRFVGVKFLRFVGGVAGRFML
jgi:hypothetical protein